MENSNKTGIQVTELFQSQLNEWELARRNYDGLSAVVCKEIDFEGFSMQIQFNPGRIRSSAAKVDTQSIQERPCFLCPANLPKEQRGISYPVDYNLLVNPFPIFNRHLTIPDRWHVVQCIEGIRETRMGDMLRLSRDLPDYVIFYNGPQSGASAPDHFHFQAGSKGQLPLEKDLHLFSGKKLLKKEAGGSVFSMENYLRKALVYQSNDAGWLIKKFDSLLVALYAMPFQSQDEEPMMNILTFYENDHWYLVVFPRIKHRPSQFFEEGDRQILFSPGAVDFGGLLIIPRLEDFEKLNPEIISDMFGQLTFTDEMWNILLNQIN